MYIQLFLVIKEMLRLLLVSSVFGDGRLGDVTAAQKRSWVVRLVPLSVRVTTCWFVTSRFLPHPAFGQKRLPPRR